MNTQEKLEAALAKRKELDAEIERLTKEAKAGKYYRQDRQVFWTLASGYITASDHHIAFIPEYETWDNCIEIARSEFLAVAVPTARRLCEDVTRSAFPGEGYISIADAAVMLRHAIDTGAVLPNATGAFREQLERVVVLSKADPRRVAVEYSIPDGYVLPKGWLYNGDFRAPRKGEWFALYDGLPHECLVQYWQVNELVPIIVKE